MATMQIYNDGEGRLFDEDLTVTITTSLPLSKGVSTKILNRFGYQRDDVWQQTDWGWQAKFIRIKQQRG